MEMVMPAALVLLFALQSNFYSDGLKAMDEKRYDAAVADFNNAIAAEPKDYALHFNLALAYSLLGKDAEGIAEYKRALELKPDLYQANLNVGILLLRDKQAGAALPYLQSAASAKPGEFRPKYYVGEALLASGDTAKAAEAYAEALAIDGKSAPAESGLARALARGNHVAEAAPHFRKAAELDGKYRADLIELGPLYEGNHQPEEAIGIYAEFPDNPAAQERWGELLLDAGKAGDAVPHLEIAVAASPTTANRTALASAYLKSGKAAKAKPILVALLAAEPKNYELHLVYGRMLRDARDFPPAAQEFARAAQLQPDKVEPWSELAGVLVLLENYPGALSALDRIAALHAEKPGHVFLRAITLDKIRQTRPALESYQRFLAMSGGKFPDEEFKARQRARILQRELDRR